MQPMEEALRNVGLMRLEMRLLEYRIPVRVRNHIAMPLARRSIRMDVLFRVRGNTWR
jgi:hypothetical protein